MIFTYPIWFIVFCIILGLLFSLALYYKESLLTIDNKNAYWAKKLMAFLRFISVGLISFLLLSPLIKTRNTETQKPIIVIAHDNSSSINLSFNQIDSAQYIQGLNNMYKSFSNEFEAGFYVFSDRLKEKDTLTFLDKKTNISNTLKEINNNYFNRNVGAVILASDGIFNDGINPVYQDFHFPLYMIALGDTNTQKDLKIIHVNANKIAYLNDKFNVEVDLESYQLKGKKYSLKLYKKSKTKKQLLQSRRLQINKDYRERKENFQIEANQVGLQQYIVEVTELDNEITYINNRFEFFVDVIDSRQKILIIANAPHPDVSVLKQTIDKNKNLEVEVEYVKQMRSNIADNNLIILHQLSSKKRKLQLLMGNIEKQKIPYWMFFGDNSNYNVLNSIQNMVKVNVKNNSNNDCSVALHKGFNAFTIGSGTQEKLNHFPPLSVPFGEFTTSKSSTTILKQKIGAVETDYPILALDNSFGLKSAVMIGEGIWRWRLHDFLNNKSHNAFQELFEKTITYLTIKSDKRKFRTNSQKTVYREGETVLIEASLYNQNYELINSPEVIIDIQNEKGASFPMVFNRTNNAYSLKTTSLAKGNYTYEASTKFLNKSYTSEGLFNIHELKLEAIQSKANHKMLHALAEKNNGAVFYPDELERLSETILNNESIKTSLFESFQTRSIIHLQWIFYLIMTLLSLEWFYRKYSGSY